MLFKVLNVRLVQRPFLSCPFIRKGLTLRSLDVSSSFRLIIVDILLTRNSDDYGSNFVGSWVVTVHFSAWNVQSVRRPMMTLMSP